MMSDNRIDFTELTSEELDAVGGSGSGWDTIEPATEGVYIDGVLVQMHASTLWHLFKLGTFRAIEVDPLTVNL